MRKVSYSAACRLDGFITDRDGGHDWITFSPEPEAAEVMTNIWKDVDAVLSGRKTFEVAQRWGAGDKAMPGVTGYVFSRTLPDRATGSSVLVREDAAEFVRRLKTRPGKNIFVMGGGELAHALFEADLIDEVSVGVLPLLLGGGAPLFHPMSRRIDLKQKEGRVFKSGGAFLRYEVVRAKRQRRPTKKAA